MQRWLKLMLALVFAAAVAAHGAHAADTAGAPQKPEHARELTEQHRAIARAHEAAALCLASGKTEQACHAELHQACKRLPIIGPLCGMRRHRH